MQVSECPKCNKLFGVKIGTGKTAVDSLPDSFIAICIHCEMASKFDKCDVKTVVDRRYASTEFGLSYGSKMSCLPLVALWMGAR
jgi:hypothetical protein